jgi:hypothetical protein
MSYRCRGGCHCGKVKFEVELPADVTVHRCNCSICKKTGFLHLIVQADQFMLLSGEADLTEYRFHTGTARHLFCRHCGIKSFYVPRSHPDAFSVNLNCVDLPEGISVVVEDFDGRNWSANRALLD